MPDAVFKNGLTTELLVSLLTFVGILGNGGKPLPDDVAAEQAETETAEGNGS